MGKEKKERKPRANSMNQHVEFSEELSDGGERNKMAEQQLKKEIRYKG